MKFINFDFSIISAIICLNGDIPDSDFFAGLVEIPIVAADGGAIKLLEKGIKADYVVGDLDSFYANELCKLIDKQQIIFQPDQNLNDFEKVLNFAMDRGFDRLLIVGINGGDYEHSLNNWSILIKYARNVELYLYHKNRITIPIFESVKFDCKENEIISIIPQPIAKIKTKGLKWELDNEYLELGIREGSRNQAISNTVEIDLLEGSFLLFKDL